ncbi:MAG TPA: recombinase family protein [Mycobacteriales bacterium]|nr:recombinase family protein [Mycobacteriales bacterium]
MRAAIYLRISKDRAGRALGVTRQRQDTTKLARALGAAEIVEYPDNDRSATNGKKREQYDRLLADIRIGALGPGDVVIAYNQDRLVRDVGELDELLALCRKTGVGLRTTTGEINLATADGRTHARLIGVIAQGEAEKIAERVARAMEQNAQQGRPHGKRAYGWDRAVTLDASGNRLDSRDVVNEQEAAIVQEIARRLIAGESVHGITDDLNARGVPAPSGKRWSTVSLRHIVMRPRNIGKRVHRGVAAFPGAWDPILDGPTYTQVLAILNDPARRSSAGNQPRYLLSMIAECGVCGEPLRATLNHNTPGYRCQRGHVHRHRVAVDEYVLDVVEEWLGSDEARALLASLGDDRTREALTEVEALEAQLAGAADDYAGKLIEREQLIRIIAVLRPKLEKARRAASVVSSRPVWADLVDGTMPPHSFGALPLDRQRAVIKTLFRVVVDRLPRPGRRGFDPSSVRVLPRELARQAAEPVVPSVERE